MPTDPKDDYQNLRQMIVDLRNAFEIAIKDLDDRQKKIDETKAAPRNPQPVGT